MTHNAAFSHSWRISIRLAVCSVLFFHSALANVDSSACQKQIENVIQTSVDCQITIEASGEAKEKLKEDSKGVVENFKCDLPLKFKKAEIYGSWITESKIQLPKFSVACLVSGKAGGAPATQAFSTTFTPGCEKASGTWICAINMAGTSGLGVIGTMVEKRANADEALKKGMREFLEKLGPG